MNWAVSLCWAMPLIGTSLSFPLPRRSGVQRKRPLGAESRGLGLHAAVCQAGLCPLGLLSTCVWRSGPRAAPTRAGEHSPQEGGAVLTGPGAGVESWPQEAQRESGVDTQSARSGSCALRREQRHNDDADSQVSPSTKYMPRMIGMTF